MSVDLMKCDRLQTYITRCFEGKATETEHKLAALDLSEVRSALERLHEGPPAFPPFVPPPLEPVLPTPDRPFIPIPPPEVLRLLARDVGGHIDECGVLPGGSGFATMSMPLPKGHWLTADPEGFDTPPMPLRLGGLDRLRIGWFKSLSRTDVADMLKAAGRYAVRCATMKGKEIDFDPDALLQNLVVGMLGYNTADGLSGDDWANPPHLRRPPMVPFSQRVDE